MKRREVRLSFTSEGGNVQHKARVKGLGITQSVTQDQAALCICVVHLVTRGIIFLPQIMFYAYYKNKIAFKIHTENSMIIMV